MTFEHAAICFSLGAVFGGLVVGKFIFWADRVRYLGGRRGRGGY